MEWKWNGKLPVYGIWKNRLPFHTMPCQQLASDAVHCPATRGRNIQLQ